MRVSSVEETSRLRTSPDSAATGRNARSSIDERLAAGTAVATFTFPLGVAPGFGFLPGR
jgi:hypothetical protein